MPVTRYRSVEEMPRRGREADDVGNLRVVAQMLALCRNLARTVPRRAGVEPFRSLHDANASQNDPYRR